MSQARISNAQFQTMFGITHMTAYLWRKGTPTRSPVPVEKPRAKLGERPNGVLFDPERVMAWAQKHGIQVLVQPEKLLKQPSAKAGPKPRVLASLPARKPKK